MNRFDRIGLITPPCGVPQVRAIRVQEFNSLDAQYDASHAYIRSQAHAGWTLVRAKYDDGGFSGGNTERPALQRLLADVRAGKVDVIVVYKVDRLTRSLADFRFTATPFWQVARAAFMPPVDPTRDSTVGTP